MRIIVAARPGAWRSFPVAMPERHTTYRRPREQGRSGECRPAIGTFLDPDLRQGEAGMAYIVFLKKCAILWPASSV